MHHTRLGLNHILLMPCCALQSGNGNVLEDSSEDEEAGNDAAGDGDEEEDEEEDVASPVKKKGRGGNSGGGRKRKAGGASKRRNMFIDDAAEEGDDEVVHSHVHNVSFTSRANALSFTHSARCSMQPGIGSHLDPCPPRPVPNNCRTTFDLEGPGLLFLRHMFFAC